MNVFPAHPLQSPAWTAFRESMGTKTVSVADGFTMSLHPLPVGNWQVGYIPKSPVPTRDILETLTSVGRKYNCIFIKLEPNAASSPSKRSRLDKSCVASPHPHFYTHSFHIDLTQSEEELLSRMKSKTRYNIKVAQKHGVTVREDNSDTAFETYIQLSKNTWERKGFRAHGEAYHRAMWKTMKDADIAHLLIAHYNPNSKEAKTAIPLAAWILFLYENVAYYPYGASSDAYKKVMGSNLMMWEAIRWSKQNNAKLFDLWGCLGSDPDKTHPWYGFHRFKQGYGGELIEYIGSYDLVLNRLLYTVYNGVYPIRKKLLGL